MTSRKNPYKVEPAVRYGLPNGQGFLKGTLFETEIEALLYAVGHQAADTDGRTVRAVLLEAARAGLCILTVDLE